MKSNNLQFAVVREDPETILACLRGIHRPRILMIGSGGCTAFCVQSRIKDAHITLVDPNPAQIDLIRKKILALKSSKRFDKFGIGSDEPRSLTSGNFEALFRCFRHFIHEFIIEQAQLEKLFTSKEVFKRTCTQLFAHKYWPVAFDLHFSDSLLLALFGHEAVQHAPPGSYPRYFQSRLEAGLMAKNAADNYFLHHIFLGYYRKKNLPMYFKNKNPDFKFTFRNCSIQEIKALKDYDLVDLSNIFDWMDERSIRKVASQLRSMRPGAQLLFRQLNHLKNFLKYFEGFSFDLRQGEKLLSQDRSLFYSKINLGKRV